MYDEETKLRFEMHAEARRDLLSRSLSNNEKFDAAILTLSIAALGFSITYIKDIVHISEARHVYILIISWIFYMSSILSVITSFQISQRGIKVELRNIEEYYINRKDEFLNNNRWTSWISRLNWASGVLFIIATISTLIFTTTNLSNAKKVSKTMSEKKFGQDGAEISQSVKVPLKEGADIVNMQKVPMQKGADVPVMQAVPSTSPSISTGQQRPSGAEVQNGADVPTMQAIPKFSLPLQPTTSEKK